MEFVNSSMPHALIKTIDPSKALEIKGVTNFITASDVPEGRNRYKTIDCA